VGVLIASKPIAGSILGRFLLDVFPPEKLRKYFMQSIDKYLQTIAF
jgi:hypothetical protein